MQKASIHQSHVYGQIKISLTVCEKSHPRNIPGKLFQNLTSGFGKEDFLRISSCPYSARSPHSPVACFWTDQNFAKIFENGHPRTISVKLFQNWTNGFRRDFKRIAQKIQFRCHGNQSFWWNQILWTIFEEDLLRNIPAKFGPNWPSSLGGGDV